MKILPRIVPCEVGQTIHIIPTGDHHFNTQDCDKDRLRGLAAWSKKQIKDGALVYFLGTGDYLDTLSPSEMAHLKQGPKGYGVHETTNEWLDNKIAEDIKEYARVWEGLEDSWLGLMTGHHVYQFQFGDRLGLTSDRLLADLLHTTFLGNGIAVVTLEFTNRYVIPWGPTFKIMLSHGYGSARTAGAQVNKRLRMAETIEGCDLYVMAHDNNKMVYPREPLIANPGSPDGVSYHKQYFIGVGGFQRGYRMGVEEAGYVEQLVLAPHQLGVNIATLRIEPKDEGFRLDYHVSS